MSDIIALMDKILQSPSYVDHIRSGYLDATKHTPVNMPSLPSKDFVRNTRSFYHPAASSHILNIYNYRCMIRRPLYRLGISRGTSYFCRLVNNTIIEKLSMNILVDDVDGKMYLTDGKMAYEVLTALIPRGTSLHVLHNEIFVKDEVTKKYSNMTAFINRVKGLSGHLVCYGDGSDRCYEDE
jgi:hypothetical protein